MTADRALHARALAAATSLTRPCTHRPEEPMPKREDVPHTDFIHDHLEDCYTRRRVTGIEAEVVDLLELDVTHRPWLRLSDAQWRRIDGLVARIDTPDAVPTPRSAAGGATVPGGAR